MDSKFAVDLDDLYQDIILDHYKHRGARPLKEEEVLVDELNPTCGDRIKLTATLEDGVITDLAFDADGCAISMASSSMMFEALKGKTAEEARTRIRQVMDVFKGTGELDEEMGDIAALEGVKQYPLRIKCATMAWHAVGKALSQLDNT